MGRSSLDPTRHRVRDIPGPSHVMHAERGRGRRRPAAAGSHTLAAIEASSNSGKGTLLTDVSLHGRYIKAGPAFSNDFFMHREQFPGTVCSFASLESAQVRLVASAPLLLTASARFVAQCRVSS